MAGMTGRNIQAEPVAVKVSGPEFRADLPGHTLLVNGALGRGDMRRVILLSVNQVDGIIPGKPERHVGRVQEPEAANTSPLFSSFVIYVA